jgi:hypothetical protein
MYSTLYLSTKHERVPHQILGAVYQVQNCIRTLASMQYAKAPTKAKKKATTTKKQKPKN